MNRPQNPFIPTDEPDWKTIPGDSHALKYDKTKEQISNTVSPSFGGNQTLPLEINRKSLKREVALRGQNSSDSSQSSVISMSPDVARKVAPPIPKKPALLSNRHHSQECRNNEQGKPKSSKPLLGGQPTFGNDMKTTLPPPKQQEIYGRQATEPDGPPLPPRSTGALLSAPSGLMDDDSEGASAIPSLQPMRRQQ